MCGSTPGPPARSPAGRPPDRRGRARQVAGRRVRRIDRLWREWPPGYELPDAERAALKETLGAPGVLTEILGDYRQLFTPPADEATQSLQARASGALTVPSLYLHGADDNCMSVELSDGMDDLFTNGLERIVIPGAGHFLHLEQPKTVADHILGFLNS
ncbi:alpha/beta hydrolase [Streptomyces sp. NBS 14/10]|uniref:alpha/beta fold hydrolase n=1 Tax=Streptomyces sp. NBS 14/10 TaxID=1945643 RepID=UPI00211B04B0|nr:alpha/beta hydrolase [Streptomyces sp. NBS 14/10]KAK1185902.1 alpha/beta hydrolase [Streptomyces sp. NBS 14/10]